jgi:hypothetical protein
LVVGLVLLMNVQSDSANTQKELLEHIMNIDVS